MHGQKSDESDMAEPNIFEQTRQCTHTLAETNGRDDNGRRQFDIANPVHNETCGAMLELPAHANWAMAMLFHTACDRGV